MAVFNYNNDVPDGPNNPSRDQAKMKINTNSIDSIINEDHYSFETQTPLGQAANGFHRQVRMPELGSIPTGLIINSGTLYVKSSLSATPTQNRSQLFYTNSTTGNEYQLTRVDDSEFTKFGLLINDPANVLANFGWTFLPGGLFLQYGQTGTSNNTTGTQNFPFTFPSMVFSAVTGTVNINSSTTVRSVTLTDVTTANFKWNLSPGSANATFHWQVIGK